MIASPESLAQGKAEKPQENAGTVIVENELPNLKSTPKLADHKLLSHPRESVDNFSVLWAPHYMNCDFGAAPCYTRNHPHHISSHTQFKTHNLHAILNMNHLQAVTLFSIAGVFLLRLNWPLVQNATITYRAAVAQCFNIVPSSSRNSC